MFLPPYYPTDYESARGTDLSPGNLDPTIGYVLATANLYNKTPLTD